MTEMKNHKLTPTKTTNTATKMSSNSQLVRTETRDTKRTETRKKYSYLKKNLHAVEEMAPCTHENGEEAAVRYIQEKRKRQMVIYHAGGKTKEKILSGK